MKKVDLHIHTTLSSDASTTLEEAVSIAKSKGCETIAITNHVPEIAGRIWYPDMKTFLAHKKDALDAGKKQGLKVLFGMEVTSTNCRGDVGVPDDLLKQCDIVLGGVHKLFCAIKMNGYQPEERSLNHLHWGIADYYQQWLGLCANKYVNVLVHPLWFMTVMIPKEEIPNLPKYFPDSYREAMVKEAVKYGKAIELNSSDGGFPDDRFLAIMKDMKVKISVGSDSHKLSEVANVDWSYAKIKEFDFKESSVLYQ